jgi:hypothetical protein
MLYSILIYDSDDAVAAMTPAEDDAIIAKHLAVHDKLKAQGKLGPVVRLANSDTARTYRPAAKMVTDGPFAETKEQLLGLYVVDCASMDEALEIARSLPVLKSSFEVRPVRLYFPGAGLKSKEHE